MALFLLVINVISYVILWLLLLLRLTLFFSRVRADITDHVRGPGFFTVVAGTCVLGSQLVIVIGEYRVAAVLWLVGLFLWAIIMYTVFAAVTVRENKPSVENGLNGAWLLAVVATQSVSVLGTLLVDQWDAYREPLLFFTLCMFLLGCMLYLLLITLIFGRPAPGGYHCCLYWDFGDTSTNAFRFVTTRSTGVWCFHWECTRSALFN